MGFGFCCERGEVSGWVPVIVWDLGDWMVSRRVDAVLVENIHTESFNGMCVFFLGEELSARSYCGASVRGFLDALLFFRSDQSSGLQASLLYSRP